jgi:hypothetical protein
VSAASTASADPITITSGSFTLSGFARGVYRFTQFSLQGDTGFAVSGTNSDGNTSVIPSCNQFDPCTPGETVSLSESFLYANAIGTATIDGTTYPLTRTSGSGSFATGTVTIPLNATDAFSLSAPFTFNALATIFSIDQDGDRVTNTDQGTFSLVGQGTITADVRRFQTGYEFASLRLDFESAASPTPEPASVVLLATGAAMLWRRSRQR